MYRKREAKVVPTVYESSVVSCFIASPVFLQKHSLLHIFSLPFPQAISWQSTIVITQGLLSNLHIPAPSSIHTSGDGSLSEVCRAVALIVSVVFTLFRLSYHLTDPNSPPMSQLISLVVGSLIFFGCPHHLGAGPVLLVLLPAFPLFLLLYLVMCVVFCKSWSICRWTIYASMERDVFHVHIFLHYLGCSSMKFSNFYLFIYFLFLFLKTFFLLLFFTLQYRIGFAILAWTLVTFKINKHKIKFIVLFTYVWLCNYCT